MKIFGLVALLLVGSCTSRPAKEEVKYSENSPKIDTTKPKSQDIVAQQLGSEAGTDLVTDLTWRAGSARPSGVAKKKIHELYKRAEAQKQEIEEVRIISWSDKEYPRKTEELSDDQVKLASQRNDVLEDIVKGLQSDFEITKINMAEQTQGMEELIDADAAGMKESVEDGDIATKDSPLEGPKKARHSIVMFMLKKDS